MTSIRPSRILDDMNTLKDIVEEEFGVSLLDISRERMIVDARMCFAKIMKEVGITHSVIGAYLGKDHSTSVHYVQKMPDIMKYDKRIFELYCVCKTKFIELVPQEEKKPTRDWITELSEAKKEIKELISYYDKMHAIEKRYKRFGDILDILELKTRKGEENLIKRKINEMLNEHSCKT